MDDIVKVEEGHQVFIKENGEWYQLSFLEMRIYLAIWESSLAVLTAVISDSYASGLPVSSSMTLRGELYNNCQILRDEIAYQVTLQNEAQEVWDEAKATDIATNEEAEAEREAEQEGKN